MSEMLIKESTLQELGDLIRTFNKTEEKIPVTQLKSEFAGVFDSQQDNINALKATFTQTVDRTITEVAAEDLDGVSIIGSYAFMDCANLSSIVIPYGVTHINASAFVNCKKMTNIYIPNSVVSIGYGVFSHCFGLNSIEIPESVRNIEQHAFIMCKNLITITIPNGVTSLGRGVFANCTSLRSATIGSGITEIANELFFDCISMNTIELPDTITAIKANAFSGCSSLTDVYYAGSKEEWMQISIAEGNDALYFATIHYGKPSEPIGCEGLDYVSNGDGTCYVAGRGTCTHTEVVIPETSPAGDTVISVAGSAFVSDMQLYEITFPDTVTTIGMFAFSGCGFLHKIVFGRGLQRIVSFAFSNCGINLTSAENPYLEFDLPSSLISIEASVFGNSKIQRLFIPDSVTSIGTRAFNSCGKYLQTIEVDPNNEVYYSKNNCLIERDRGNILLGCGESVIPDDGTILEIHNGAFSNSSLASVVIPNSVITIRDNAFSYCKNLTEILIPNSVQYIGLGVFTNCTSLVRAELLLSGSSIPSLLFDGCTALTEVTIPTNITSISSAAFQNCTSLAHVYYAASITEWSKIVINDGNESLLNATIHYVVEKPTTIFYAKDLITTVKDGQTIDAVVTDNNYVTYTYITYTPSGTDPFYFPFANVEGNRYLSIRYRTSTAAGAFLQFYIGSSGSAPYDDSTMMKTAVNADGQWHLVVFDLQHLIDTGKYDGKNISYFRFDVLDAQGGTMPAGASIDIKYIAFFETEEGARQEEEIFFEPNATETFVAPISKAFKYCAHVDTINFNNYGLGDGYRDDSSGSAVIVTPVIDNYGAGNLNVDDVAGDEAVLVLSGWAIVNGGQDKYFWSLDGNTWTEVAKGIYGLANEAQVNAARAKGVDAAVHANGTFKDVVIDLSAYRGQTLSTLYVAVRSTTTAGTPPAQKLCHFLTFTNCTIPN